MADPYGGRNYLRDRRSGVGLSRSQLPWSGQAGTASAAPNRTT